MFSKLKYTMFMNHVILQQYPFNILDIQLIWNTYFLFNYLNILSSCMFVETVKSPSFFYLITFSNKSSNVKAVPKI